MIEHDKNDHPPSKKETSNAAKTVAQQSDTAKTPAAFEFTPLSFLQSMMVMVSEFMVFGPRLSITLCQLRTDLIT